MLFRSLEHGLADQGSSLGITVSENDHQMTVTVSDDGVGLPTGFDIATSPNLGLQIVRTLTENELRGELKLRRLDGRTQAELTFPVN